MKTNLSVRASIRILWVLTTLCFFLNSPVTYAAAIVEELTNTYVVITRYEIQDNAKDQIAKTLNTYVQQALANENNIMAEVFQEQEHPSVLWLLERWGNKDKFEDFSQSTQVKALLTLPKIELVQPVKIYHLKDLAPLSKSEWRKAPSKDDTPIVIMLFVDSKKGTEDNFTKLYHTAMPKFRSEPGVITYGLSQFEDDRTQFVTYEKFRNEDAFKYHLNFPPIQPVLDYLNTSIKRQPFQTGLHRLVPLTMTN
jgi:quinol monooxygenase YgiN